MLDCGRRLLSATLYCRAAARVQTTKVVNKLFSIAQNDHQFQCFVVRVRRYDGVHWNDSLKQFSSLFVCIYLFCFAFSRNRMTHFLNLLHFSLLCLVYCRTHCVWAICTHFNGWKRIFRCRHSHFLIHKFIFIVSFWPLKIHIWVAKVAQPHTSTGFIHSISPRRHIRIELEQIRK